MAIVLGSLVPLFKFHLFATPTRLRMQLQIPGCHFHLPSLALAKVLVFLFFYLFATVLYNAFYFYEGQRVQGMGLNAFLSPCLHSGLWFSVVWPSTLVTPKVIITSWLEQTSSHPLTLFLLALGDPWQGPHRSCSSRSSSCLCFLASCTWLLPVL